MFASMKQVFTILLTAIYMMLAVSAALYRDSEEASSGKALISSVPLKEGHYKNKGKHCKQCERYGAVKVTLKTVKTDNALSFADAVPGDMRVYLQTVYFAVPPIYGYSLIKRSALPIYLSDRSILI